ncbi:MAG: ACP S-malonyltransferase [Planctomycetes bacterium]|nr:ACP S-malonyltransferase [Planctomycetota bacterium]
MSRVAIFCAGRGSYTERALRSLPPDHPFVARAEELRAELDLQSLVSIDHAPKFDPKLHLAPANVSPLIWLVTMMDAAGASKLHDVVCVGGNSMGWYTALAVAGALGFDDGFRLVQEMAILQQDSASESGGGQVIYPLVDDEWRPDALKRAAVEAAIASSNGAAFHSIDLGGYAVLAGTEAGITHLLGTLPSLKLGSTTYPFRLMQHGPYHTPLCASVAAAARERLASLEFHRPSMTLIDGRGVRHTPWSASPQELRGYTLGAQIVEPYDFTSSVRVALREHAPEHIVLPGPGNSLGGVCGQVLIAEGWAGIRSRTEFVAAHERDSGIVLSMRR